MNASGSTPDTFMHRLLWWLAILALVHGAVDVLSLFVQVSDSGLRILSYPQYRGDAAFSVYMTGYAGSLGAGLFLVVGALGLLKWKRWARHLLMAWAFVYLPLSLLAAVGNVMVYARYAATTQPASVRLPYMFWSAIASLILRSVFPIFVLTILWQREVRETWSSRRSEGFAVIPLAKPAEGQSEE